MLPRPSPTAKLVKMPIRVAALAFDLRVLYYRSLFSQNSLTTKKTGEKGDFRSIHGVFRARAHGYCNVPCKHSPSICQLVRPNPSPSLAFLDWCGLEQ